MRVQYRLFLRRLEELLKEEDRKAKEKRMEFTSIEIMKRMLKTDDRRYEDCEGIMDVLTRAACLKSVESVIESWISVLEHHASKRRNLGQERIEDELEIAINGPTVPQADNVLKEALNDYWKDSKNRNNRDGHYIRRSENIQSYDLSKTIDRIRSVPPKLPFMV